MLKQACLLLFFLCFSAVWAQETKTPYQTKKITASEKPIVIDSVSINREFFKLLDRSGNEIDTLYYTVDFQKGTLAFKNSFKSEDTLTVRYLKFPEYLTKKYSIYDQSRIVSNEAGRNLYRVSREPITTFKPFDGLSTTGNISRGVTVGNNQNAVVNSNLDLQISGKISEKVSLRASLQDSNIPLQEGGYSQRLDEFDQIFVELFSDKWAIRAGDLFLENRQSDFLNFSKKVQGLSTHFTFGQPENKTDLFVAGAIVRGQYTRSSFTGQEGNQGPYKLTGPNGELYVLVISGSERVYVNGILLERGENNDYIIDYNAGEIRFTSLFPVTSEMRINVEYQYSERSYTRFVTYGGVTHQREKWSIGTFLYSENDVKNQPLQQNLSPEQAQILVQAGDNPDLMTAPSAYEDSYSENKILYRKIMLGTVEVFEYSNNPDDVLYNVKFTLVGNNLGNYVLANNQTIGRIYEYVAPVNGVPQGNYEPITKLIPPTKLQIATVLGKYNPTEKTSVDFEFGLSNNDKNLFSGIDDNDNQGIAAKINAKQRLLSRKWNVDGFADYQFVQEEFRTIERLFTIEFNRDWNLTNPEGDQSLLISGANFELPGKGFARYQIEKLDFSENFSGTRHVADGLFKLNQWTFSNNSSALKSDSRESESQFIRSQTLTKYHFKRNWVGGSFRMEDNEEKIKATNQFSALSQRYNEIGAFVGRGDSTRVYTEIGYLRRSNDSLLNGSVQKVNTSDSYYLKSKLIQNDKSDLGVFINYRDLKFEDPARTNEPSLNSRILYTDRFFDQLIQIGTTYETSSGTLAQQEYTYVEVEPGLGLYTWNDYNGNGVQELQEFELAPFPDQAKYVRVFLPNQIFVKTHQNKFSQSLTLNPIQWQNETGVKKLLSYFYNQTSFLMDRKIERHGDNFDLNPFSSSDKDLLGLNETFRNAIFYNRGKQHHSVTYTYLNNHVKALLSAGSQESKAYSHQLQYAHLVQKIWLFGFNGKTLSNKVTSENYQSKNYVLEGYLLAPKISYLFSQNASWDVFYEFQNKENRINEKETLNQQRMGTSFTYSSEKKFTANGEFSFYKNAFEGNQLSAVAYQMLEGLQPGKNLTWNLLLQKNLTQYLDVNVNYQGRKSETSQTIHTGNIQLRAYF